MGMLSSGCARLCHKGYGGQAHDDLGFASGAPSGWNAISLLFTYPACSELVEGWKRALWKL